MTDQVSRRGHAGEAEPPPADGRKPIDHFYQDIEGWFDFENLYREAVRRMPADGTKMVEVGVYKGRSIFFLAVEALNSMKDIHVVGVDRFDHTPSALEDFSRIRREHLPEDLLSVIIASSVQAARQFDDETLDFVFIDADHEYESVKADIAAWWPKVKPGGILAGHDFAREFPGVERAVREHFCEEDIDSRSGNFFRVYGPRSWWVDKL